MKKIKKKKVKVNTYLEKKLKKRLSLIQEKLDEAQRRIEYLEEELTECFNGPRE